MGSTPTPRPQKEEAGKGSLSRSFLFLWMLLLAVMWAWAYSAWTHFEINSAVFHDAEKARQRLAWKLDDQDGPSWSPERLALMQASLQDPAELNCLALTVYFEARGEPIEGQMAVAQVILARVEDPDYPDTICGVVKQALKPGPFRCQFTAWCDELSDTPRNLGVYRSILGLSAIAMLAGPPPNAPTHYHADYVSPNWPELAEVSRVGGHVFYR